MTGSHILRLFGALLAAAILMSVLATVIAFLIYGSWETEARAVFANTRFAGIVAISAFTVFNLTCGLATVLLLRWKGWTGALAFAAGGAAAGLVFGLVSALAFGNPVDPVVLLVLAAIGAAMLPLVRVLARLWGQ